MRAMTPARVEESLLGKVADVFVPATKLGRDGAAEAIHKMRVASRWLRVGLKFFADVFPANELRQVRRHVRRITRALGGIRALDVNLRLLRGAHLKLPESTALARAALGQNLLVERNVRLAELRELLRSEE